MGKPFDIPGEVPQQPPNGFIMETYDPEFHSDTLTHQDIRFGIFNVLYTKMEHFPTKMELDIILDMTLQVETFIKKADGTTTG